jgi:DNA-binding transcriptional MerR regulator
MQPLEKMTRKDVAKYFGVTTRTITAWRAKGILPPAKRVGGLLFWSPADIANAIEAEGNPEKPD